MKYISEIRIFTSENSATPLGLGGVLTPNPRVAPSSQPRAGGRNPFGIVGAVGIVCRNSSGQLDQKLDLYLTD